MMVNTATLLSLRFRPSHFSPLHETEALADRIVYREILRRELLIDDDLLHRQRAVLVGKTHSLAAAACATRPRGTLQRRSRPGLRRRIALAWRGRGAALQSRLANNPIQTSGALRRHHQRRRLEWSGAAARAVRRTARRASGVSYFGGGRISAQRHQAAGAESEILRVEFGEAANHQAGAGRAARASAPVPRRPSRR